MKINDKTYFGTWQERAPGINASVFIKNNKNVQVLPIIQKYFVNIEILDYFCAESDHTFYNYNVILNEEMKPYKIMCFDNNNVYSFSNNLYPTGHLDENCIINKRGLIDRPYLDYELVNRVLDINYDVIKEQLKKHLSQKQIKWVIERIKLFKDAYQKTISIELNKDNDWNEHTIDKECCGDFGITHLSKFVNHK